MKNEKNTTPAITARIDRMLDGEGSTRAFASVTIGGAFAVHDLRITEKDDKLTVRMPFRSYKSDGKIKYTDIFHAVTAEARAKMIEAVLDAYQQTLDEQMEQKNAGMSQQM